VTNKTKTNKTNKAKTKTNKKAKLDIETIDPKAKSSKFSTKSLREAALMAPKRRGRKKGSKVAHDAPLEWIVSKAPSKPLSEEESAIIASMQGVTFKPRERVSGGHWNRHQKLYEVYGFLSEWEFGEWCEYNRLDNPLYSGYSLESDHNFDGISLSE
jgi:hypothetical protein